MIMSGKNPEQMMMDFLRQNMAGTPMGNNLLQLAQQGDKKGIENVARNYFKQQGKDFDKEFQMFRKQFGI